MDYFNKDWWEDAWLGFCCAALTVPWFTGVLWMVGVL